MKRRTFDELVRHLQDQREMGEPSPVVLLGAGASREVGIEDMKGLYALVGAADFDAFVTYIADRSVGERYALLGRYLSTKQPEQITDGYRALATLCARAFFDVVLTTNLDPLMDDALVEADLWRRDYVLLVNGLLRSERLGPVLASRHPRVKIVKLHGDLYLRFMAWTPDEMDEYLEDIEPYLAPTLRGREVLVVGQSLRDERIRQLVLSTGGLVWFATPGPAPDHLDALDQVLVVEDDRCRFEALFPALADALDMGLQRTDLGLEGLRSAPAPAATTTDDLMAAVVGVGGFPDMPAGTGFILETPRVIVTDVFPAGPDRAVGDQVNVTFADGRELALPIVARLDHPFGPVVLAPPPDVAVPGLRLAPATLGPGDRVTMAVAAGSATGLSTGTVTGVHLGAVDIAPLGSVSGLVEIRARVAGGSSGAPIVDDSMHVVGFVVAGSSDPDNPQTFMLPATQWADALDRLTI